MPFAKRPSERTFLCILLQVSLVDFVSFKDIHPFYRLIDGLSLLPRDLNAALIHELIVDRAQRDTVLPLSTPIKDRFGNTISEIPILKGTNVQVNIYGYNRNKELWGEDAEEWKPERWLSPLPEPLIQSRMPGVYSHM